jgi:hypothetical protein
MGGLSVMEIIEKLRQQFGELVSLEEVSDGVMRIYAPFFYEDGDMLSMYLQRKPDGGFLIRDYGNTLMRISYTFDIDTENKRNVLNNIIQSNYGRLDDTELLIDSGLDALPQSIFQFSQLLAKVSNIELLQRQVVKSLFYDYLNEFINATFSNYAIKKNIAPTEDGELIVDYKFDMPRPLFVFGVNGDIKASKVVISCLYFQKNKLPFRSLVVHEDFEGGLNSFYRRQITNTVDKQFTSLDEFKSSGSDYISREIA